MLRYRITLGPLLIASLVALAWLDQWLEGRPLGPLWQRVFLGRERVPPGTVLFPLCVLIGVMAARELATIMRARGILASKRITTTAAIIGLGVSCLMPGDLPAPAGAAVVSTAAVVVLLMALAFNSRHRTTEGSVAAAGGTLLAFVYLGLMFGFVLAIRREHSVWVLLWVVLVAKSCDIGAYFTGITVGRHKMIKWLSPGKTWEGLAGGVAVAAVVGAAGLWALRALAGEATPPIWSGACAGVLFGVTGQLGDLVASLFKRDAGIKDSGAVLPGFGGVLDVLDSPLLVAPVAYWWVHSV